MAMLMLSKETSNATFIGLLEVTNGINKITITNIIKDKSNRISSITINNKVFNNIEDTYFPKILSRNPEDAAKYLTIEDALKRELLEETGMLCYDFKIVAKNVLQYKKDNPNTSILIITHLPKLLEYLSSKGYTSRY